MTVMANMAGNDRNRTLDSCSRYHASSDGTVEQTVSLFIFGKQLPDLELLVSCPTRQVLAVGTDGRIQHAAVVSVDGGLPLSLQVPHDYLIQ